MKLLIDGDGCPDKEAIYQLSCRYHVEMIVFVDYAHIIKNRSYSVVYCEIGQDSVDMEILNQANVGDIVITQDYGLAGLLLSKGCTVLHVNGMIIDSNNIDSLLMTRYIGVKSRKRDKHIQGPRKRNRQDKEKLLKQLEYLLLK